MPKRIAINGFGRIGRLTFRNLFMQDNVDIVAINDLTDNATLAHLLQFDSAHGRFDSIIDADDTHLVVNGHRIAAFSERDPSDLPWSDLAVDVVLECTGVFRTREEAGKHLDAGAKRVLLSAPAKSDDIQTIVIGVNDEELSDSDNIVSNASCTTNCAAQLAKIVGSNWGFRFGSLTTVHAYTADQRIQDAPHRDLRRARAAAFNIVPTSTGAATAVGKVYPAVRGKMFATAIRVPVIAGSIVELNCQVDGRPTIDEINRAFQTAANGPLQGILEYSDDELVSSDIVRNQHSAIFDSKLTNVLGSMIKVVAWYDNEAGYAARLADLAMRM